MVNLVSYWLFFNVNKISFIVGLILLISACGGSTASSNNQVSTTEIQALVEEQPIETAETEVTNNSNVQEDVIATETDLILAILIERLNLEHSPIAGRNLPNINSPLAQLGKKLFFSKSLGGGLDTACASCHHPVLGGGDNLSLPIGVLAQIPELLGVGRTNHASQPLVPRNSPSVFNVGLWDTGLFWDSRVESMGKEVGENGAASGISTPDSGFNNIDVNAGDNLVAAQAKFPVTSIHEMKTADFENEGSNKDIRDHLAARIGDFGEGFSELTLNNWLAEFQQAFNSNESGEALITFNNIAHAIGEYQRSMVFINSPWRNYVNGDLTAITQQQKRGAVLFFEVPAEGGAGCSGCHSGSFFTDGEHHVIGFPQIGLGKGHGDTDDEDFGRFGITNQQADLYTFRTPTLLNVSKTAPYTHAGAYQTLEQVVRHYDNPRQTAEQYIDQQAWCNLPQFELIDNCASLYPNSAENTENALQRLEVTQRNPRPLLPNINLNDIEIAQLVGFLESLTDPCVENRACLSPWIAEQATDNPDGQVLVAISSNGDAL